jgi:hypothetical protein
MAKWSDMMSERCPIFPPYPYNAQALQKAVDFLAYDTHVVAMKCTVFWTLTWGMKNGVFWMLCLVALVRTDVSDQLSALVASYG